MEFKDLTDMQLLEKYSKGNEMGFKQLVIYGVTMNVLYYLAFWVFVYLAVMTVLYMVYMGVLKVNETQLMQDELIRRNKTHNLNRSKDRMAEIDKIFGKVGQKKTQRKK